MRAARSTLSRILTLSLIALVGPSPARAARPIEILDEAPDRVRALAALVPTGAVLRDVATFEAARGKPAALLLWVTDAQPIPDEPDLESCPGQAAGVPLTGVYHLGLALDGAVVNEVVLPSPSPDDGPTLSLPVANTRYHDREHWGQGAPLAWDAPGASDLAPTRLLRLADYTGDGRAFEVRFVTYVAACGHLETLLAGYSPSQGKVVVFPIVSGERVAAWHDNLFGNPAAPHPKRLSWRWPCGDHGADTEERETFRFDPKAERWVRVAASSKRCSP